MDEAMRIIMDPLKRDLEEGKKAKEEAKKLTDQLKAKEKELADLDKKMKAEKEDTRR